MSYLCSCVQVRVWLQSFNGAIAVEHLLVKLWSPTGDTNLGIFTEGNIPLLHHNLPLGVPQWVCETHYQANFWRRYRGRHIFKIGELHTSIFIFIIYLACLLYLLLAFLYIKNPQKLVCLVLLLLVPHLRPRFWPSSKGMVRAWRMFGISLMMLNINLYITTQGSRRPEYISHTII